MSLRQLACTQAFRATFIVLPTLPVAATYERLGQLSSSHTHWLTQAVIIIREGATVLPR